MVTKTEGEIADMRALIAKGELPADAIEKHFEAEEKAVFGHDCKYDDEGEPIEQGIGSAAQPSRNSINAYIVFQTEQRKGGPEKGYEENLAAMEANFLAYQERVKAEGIRKAKLSKKARAA